VYFPDPWPKKRHHKRRLLQAPFVHDLAMRLAPGGYLHVATDWAPYADEILAVMAAEPLLANTSDGFAPRPVWRPLTKFEQRGIARGHAVFDMLFTKRPA
jgi:tRNA (guanine-N7-)-methyltransferase